MKVTLYPTNSNITIEFEETQKKYIRITHSSTQDEQTEVIAWLKNSPCYNCEKFEAHSALVKLQKKVKHKMDGNMEEIGKLHQLFGAEQFNQMVHVLQALGYVDDDFLPTPKLNMARKLMAGPEVLLLCEVFYANLFNVSYVLIC
jgi:hypothetical protein